MYEFSVMLPSFIGNPKAQLQFPYACIELFIMNEVFNLYYKQYELLIEEYSSIGLSPNKAYLSDSELYQSEPVNRVDSHWTPVDLNKLVKRDGRRKLQTSWGLHFNKYEQSN
jgi:hypothetical protein